MRFVSQATSNKLVNCSEPSCLHLENSGSNAQLMAVWKLLWPGKKIRSCDMLLYLGTQGGGGHLHRTGPVSIAMDLGCVCETLTLPGGEVNGGHGYSVVLQVNRPYL